jgi:hypothetical protein
MPEKLTAGAARKGRRAVPRLPVAARMQHARTKPAATSTIAATMEACEVHGAGSQKVSPGSKESPAESIRSQRPWNWGYGSGVGTRIHTKPTVESTDTDATISRPERGGDELAGSSATTAIAPMLGVSTGRMSGLSGTRCPDLVRLEFRP